MRLEALAGLRDESLVDVEAGASGEEGGVGLEVVDLRFEDFEIGDVGRVGDDGVEGFRRDGVEQVRLKKADACGEVVMLGVVSGDGERGGRGIECGDGGLRHRVGEGDGDGSRAGADVGDGDGRVVREEFERGFDEMFGFWTRDEDVRRDAEREAVELLLAGDVLDGLVLGAAVDPLVVGGELVGCDGCFGVGEQEGAVDAGGAHE